MYKGRDFYLNNISTNWKFIKDKEGVNLVTIITICYNSEKTILKTIESVFSQTFKNIEYIVIDGGSTDNTINLIKSNESGMAFWLSEPDFGPSDALNKGLVLAKGQYIFMLNSDDFIDENFIETTLKEFDDNCDFVFGDLKIGEFGKEYNRVQKGDKNYKKKIKYTMPNINQPSIVFKKRCFDRVGLYNIEKKIAPDHEFLLRCDTQGLIGKYSCEIVSYFSLCGLSDRNYFMGIKDVRDSCIYYSDNKITTKIKIMIYYLCRYYKRMLKK
jgi:glycosyltransferase involved in cell wall biosynthesis